jgi:adenylate kinase
MGTYTDPLRTDKLPGIKKILKRYKPKLFRKKMMEENDVWIYDTSSASDLAFALDILEKVTTFEEPKVLILLSDIRSWSSTPPK